MLSIVDPSKYPSFAVWTAFHNINILLITLNAFQLNKRTQDLLRVCDSRFRPWIDPDPVLLLWVPGLALCVILEWIWKHQAVIRHANHDHCGVCVCVVIYTFCFVPYTVLACLLWPGLCLLDRVVISLFLSVCLSLFLTFMFNLLS